MNSDYTIEFIPSAAGQFRKLPKSDQFRLAAVIDKLAANPRPPGNRSLQGHPGLLHIRVGTLRVVYQIEDDRLIVLIVRVARRPTAYRNLSSKP